MLYYSSSSLLITALLFAIVLSAFSTVPKCQISIPPLSESVIEENNQITRAIHRQAKLKQFIIGLTKAKNAGHTKNLLFTFLEMASSVVKKACPDNFVSHKHAIDGAIEVFAFLYDNAGGGGARHLDDPLNPSMYTRISSALSACEQTDFAKKYYFSSEENDKCWEDASAISQVCHTQNGSVYDPFMIKCYNLNLKYEKRKRTECFQNSNLMLDIVWIIVEIAHTMCFKEFQNMNDISAFQIWEQALEGLFTRKIRKYWYEALLSKEMYQTILHPNILQQIFNLEMCREGVHHVMASKMRLQRPRYPLMLYGKRRRKRSIK